MKSLTVALVVCLATALPYCHAFCYYEPAVNIFDIKTMKPISYCKLGTKKWKMDEETVDLEACEKCTCKSNALTCCGIGYSAGTVHPPEGCFKKKLENCCYQFVQQANDAVSCGEKVCPET